MNLWDWFMAPTFNLAPSSFWMMYGLLLVVRAFSAAVGDDSWIENRRSQAKINAMVDACIPEERRESVNKKLEEIEGHIWENVSIPAIVTVMGNTFVLGLGFVIHILAS
jgi:hypothetical protein